MPHDELKPKDRVVLRMTRDGAVEENLTEGTSRSALKMPSLSRLMTQKPVI